MAKRVFIQKIQLITNKKLNIKVRKIFVNYYVWSVLEDMELWMWRRLLKISWTEIKSNINVLEQIN